MNIIQHDVLVRLKHAAITQTAFVQFNFNKKILPVVSFLYKQGLVQSFFSDEKKIIVTLRYLHGQNCLSKLKLLSKPTYKNYMKYSVLCRLNSRGVVIGVSADCGVLSLNDCRIKKIGGKGIFLC